MSTRFRPNFDDALSELQSMVLRMGNVALDMVRLACEAVSTGNLEAANQVAAWDDEVDRLEDECVMLAMATVMRESPVARDLKRLTATIGIVGEIEKVGDDAVKLAGRTAKLVGVIPIELKSSLVEMSEQSRRLFSSALRLYSDYDEGLAQEIINSDEVVDQLYHDVRSRAKELIRENPALTSGLLRTIDAFHTLEHVADHAVEISCRLRLHFGASL